MAYFENADGRKINREKICAKRYEKWALLSFGLAAISWYICLVVNPSNLELVFLVLCSALTILFAGFFFICVCARIGEKRGKNVSPYRVFAVVDIAIGLLIAAYAVWDVASESGWFGGLVGIFLFLFVMPVVVLFLVADFILYERKK